MFTPDGFDRLSTTTYPNATTEALTYDADNNVLTRKTRAGATIAFNYDTLNRLNSKTPPSPAPVVTYAYDLASRLISVSDSSSAIVPPSGSAASYGTTIGYDQLNRPANVSWSPAPSQATPTASSTTFTFGYDATNRRISQSATDNSWWNYPTTAANVSYTANNLNQYSAIGAVTPAYDNNGNLTYDGTFTYCYDSESRMAAIIQGGTCASPGTTVATYAYDAQGRRKSKTVGSSTTIYVTDNGNREVLEYDGSSGAVQNWYSFALGPDDVLNQVNVAAGTRATLIPDVQGSIIGAPDSGAGTLTRIGYRPYGENPGLTSGSYRYTARRFDPETAGSTAQPSGLYYYRARMYSPTLGRFMQPDPVGYSAGIHLYVYVNNDPLNNSDPSGQFVFIPYLIAGGIGAILNTYVEVITNPNYNAQSLAIAAGTGFLGGALGVALPEVFAPRFGLVAAQLIGGGSAGGFSNGVSQILTTEFVDPNKQFDYSQLFSATAFGVAASSFSAVGASSASFNQALSNSKVLTSSVDFGGQTLGAIENAASALYQNGSSPPQTSGAISDK